ncbi:MAG: hypothetical protein V3W41_16850 [Planctomycetota bacterium]
MRVALGFWFWFIVLALSLSAQDFVRLHSGERIRGEIRNDSAKSVQVIDHLGQLREFAKKDVKSIKKGRPLQAKVMKRLKGVDAKSPKALFEVVQWANQQGKFKRATAILARRVLALDSNHLEARALLGHIRTFDVWYLNANTRDRAVAKIMKAKGLRLQGKGWLDPLQLDLVKANPKDWIVDPDSFRWRILRELREEQGMSEWGGQWYEFDEARVLEEMAVVKTELSLKCQGAESKKIVVYGTISRKLAQEHVLEILKARDWYVKTFCPQDALRVGLMPASIVIFRSLPQAQAFIDKGHGVCHSAEAEFAAFCRPTGAMAMSDYSQLTQQERKTWRHDGVARVGMGLMAMHWTGQSECPDWIDNAAAHHAEFAVFGRIETVWIALSRYARQERTRSDQGRTIKAAKEMLIEDYKKHRTITVRQLFSRRTNQMTAADDTMGVVLMTYLLEKYRAKWLKFLFKSTSINLEKRAQLQLGMNFPQLEAKFRTWLGIR